MSKNRYGKMQGNMQYNRPSGGYQKNLYKQQLKTEGIKQPKGVEQKTLRNYAIAAAVVWVVISVLLIMKFKWWGLLVALVIGTAAVGGFYLWIRKKEKDMIVYYKKIGMTEDMYIKELRKRNVDKRQIEAVRKTWRKTNVESIADTMKAKK
ncbi:MAG: hypothetical protein IJ227_00570 [Mogibacterium sp.]|nr:hypothetical protein [Mogibacterium sp.]